jgi:hypothetical protein
MSKKTTAKTAAPKTTTAKTPARRGRGAAAPAVEETPVAVAAEQETETPVEVEFVASTAVDEDEDGIEQELVDVAGEDDMPELDEEGDEDEDEAPALIRPRVLSPEEQAAADRAARIAAAADEDEDEDETPASDREGAKDASGEGEATDGAPETPGAAVTPRNGKKTAPENLPPGRRKYAAKVALRAAIASLDAFTWSEWGIEGLAGARGILARAHEKLEQTSLPRGRKPAAGLDVGTTVRIAAKHAAHYEGALSKEDAAALTVAAVAKGFAHVDTRGGARLVLPMKHLEVAAAAA